LRHETQGEKITGLFSSALRWLAKLLLPMAIKKGEDWLSKNRGLPAEDDHEDPDNMSECSDIEKNPGPVQQAQSAHSETIAEGNDTDEAS